jgi:hypothetical protein
MADVNKMRNKLIEAGRLQDERDIQMFDALADQAPEILALVYAAALSGIFVTDSDCRNVH